MGKVRIGVIGLGWFGEIPCEAIIGIPNLELATLQATRAAEETARARQLVRINNQKRSGGLNGWPREFSSSASATWG
jgi:hypothetical protein